MSVTLAILTYAAYAFIMFVEIRKAVKCANMPAHLRWNLYPVMREDGRNDGRSDYEDREWRTKARRRRHIRSILFILKDNFYLGEYFHRNKGYWCVLFPWHVGFLLLIAFNAFCFFAAIALVAGFSVSPQSAGIIGSVFYYSILITGVGSFITGSFGSIGMIVKKLSSRELRAYASPINYFNYLFLLVLFLSGFYAWHSSGRDFSPYTEFWKGLITLSPRDVHFAWAIHIVLFALVKFYLPFTRSMHYITRFFSFLWVYWDDEPNVKRKKIERKVQESLNQPVSWSAPHVPSGKTWTDLASELISPGQIRTGQ